MTTRRRWLTRLLLGGLLAAWLPWCCTTAWADAPPLPAAGGPSAAQLSGAAARSDSGPRDCTPDADDRGNVAPECSRLVDAAEPQIQARAPGVPEAAATAVMPPSVAIGPATTASPVVLVPGSFPEPTAARGGRAAPLYLAYSSFLE